MLTIGPEHLQPRTFDMHLRRIFDFTERGAANPTFHTFFSSEPSSRFTESLEASVTISPGSAATERPVTDLCKI
jgi:hypothetical protein